MVRTFGNDLFSTVFKVEIHNPHLNDAQLEELSGHLSRLPDLEIVNISHASISDAGLESLASLPSSVNLGIMFCPITDDGLTHLEHFSSSQEMWLIGTNVTNAGAARLAEALPDCAIMYDADGEISAEQMSAHLARRGPHRGTH